MRKLIWLAVIAAVLQCSCPPPLPPPPGPPGPPRPPRKHTNSSHLQMSGVSQKILVELPEEAMEGQSSAYLVVKSDR